MSNIQPLMLTSLVAIKVKLYNPQVTISTVVVNLTGNSVKGISLSVVLEIAIIF